MSFSPVIPSGGLPGWMYLGRTLDAQKQTHQQSPEPARDIAAFKDRITGITSAETLVQDRTVLKVALGAFGLQEDLNNRAFIEKVLREGTESRDSFANRLADKRYAAFADAFGFGNVTGPRTSDPGFADAVSQRYLERDFEIAVGTADQTLRLGLTLQRELPDIVAQGGSDTTQWLRLLGNPPLRQSIETAFGLPSSFSGLDLDRQVDDLANMARQRLGADSLSELAAPAPLEALTRLFVARSETSSSSVSTSPVLNLFGGTANAATLLQILAQRP